TGRAWRAWCRSSWRSCRDLLGLEGGLVARRARDVEEHLLEARRAGIERAEGKALGVRPRQERTQVVLEREGLDGVPSDAARAHRDVVPGEGGQAHVGV